MSPEVPPLLPENAAAPTPRVFGGIDRVLAVQRPVVLAHLRQIRRAKPEASPAEVLRILERRYLTAVTTGGAAVGAAASFPAIGTGASIALSGVETAGFIETTALYAQSVAELHGIVLEDPDRARTLVMTMILGNGGKELLEQLALQAAGRGQSRSRYWGELVGKNLPGPIVSMVADRLKQAFLKRFAVSQGGSIIGRTIPFGVGAVVGGAGNHLLARRVVASARDAFGPLPDGFSPELESFRKVTPEERELRRRIPRPSLPIRNVRDAITRRGKTPRARLESGDAAPLAIEAGADAPLALEASDRDEEIEPSDAADR